MRVPDRVVDAVEIACDESGFTGGNLTFPHAVFSHASVRVSVEAADQEMSRLRRRVVARGELKASWLLRWCDHDDLRRLLTVGEVIDDALVQLSDIRLFLLLRLADALEGAEEVHGIDLPGASPAAWRTAATLTALGEPTYGATAWQDFLTASGHLLRTPSRWIPASAVEDFEELTAQLLTRPAPPPLHAVLERLRAAAPRARILRRMLHEEPRRSPLLEPLLPAVAYAVLSWGAEHRSVRLCHDEQSALTPWRVAEMRRRLAEQHPGHAVELERVDSRDDARVQLADLVAGIARRAACGVLAGRPDPELVALVRPLVASSIWADSSWRPEPTGVRETGVREVTGQV